MTPTDGVGVFFVSISSLPLDVLLSAHSLTIGADAVPWYPEPWTLLKLRFDDVRISVGVFTCGDGEGEAFDDDKPLLNIIFMSSFRRRFCLVSCSFLCDCFDSSLDSTLTSESAELEPVNLMKVLEKTCQG